MTWHNDSARNRSFFSLSLKNRWKINLNRKFLLRFGVLNTSRIYWSTKFHHLILLATFSFQFRVVCLCVCVWLQGVEGVKVKCFRTRFKFSESFRRQRPDYFVGFQRHRVPGSQTSTRVCHCIDELHNRVRHIGTRSLQKDRQKLIMRF